MTIQEAVARHLESLTVRNFAKNTLINRAYQLRFFHRFLDEREPPVQEIERVTAELLVEFQSWLYHQPTPKGAARGVANQNRIFTVSVIANHLPAAMKAWQIEVHEKHSIRRKSWHSPAAGCG